MSLVKSKEIFLLVFSTFLFGIVITFAYQPAFSASLPNVHISTVGDWMCNGPAQQTENNIRTKNPDLVLALGDYSYASTATCWFNLIKPTDKITKINIGNHETDSSSLESSYMQHFGLSSQYYSFDFPSTQPYIHVLTMATEKSTSSGSAQFNFVKNDLQAASQNPNIKWIIVSLHKPIYSSPNECSASGCQGSSSLRDIYHVIFDQYHVNLVLQGHVHSYQRTYPLKYNPSDKGVAIEKSNPIKTSTNKNTYSNPEGEIYAIVGIGGAPFHSLGSKTGYTVTQQSDGKNGILDMVFSNNGSKLEAKNYGNDGIVRDTFTITKSSSNSPPIANNQAVSVVKNTTKSITLTASDPDGNSLIYTVVAQPTHGSLTGTAPSLTYSPTTNYVGPDSFKFKVNDGAVDSNIATVTINVTSPTDTTPPTVVSTNPVGGAPGVLVSSTVTATFSEAVQSSTVTSSFTLKTGTTNVPGSVTLSADKKTATFSPSSSLASSTSYTATITTGVKDLAGNAMTTDKVWSFTTAAASPPPDTTPPTVVSTNPANGAPGIAVSTSIAATFSEEVQASTVSPSTFTVKTGTTNVLGSVATTVSSGKTVATFSPSPQLAASTAYTATIKGGSTGVKDLAGNAMTQDFSWSFTTAAAPPPPPLSSCDNNLATVGATSSGHQSSFIPNNAIDNDPSTRWYSTFIVNPWISVDLGGVKSICSVDISWTDGSSRQYTFTISVSIDGTSFTNVFSGISKGTTSSAEKYSFAEAQARFVKITITKSHTGSTNSLAQISEIDIFGKITTSSLSVSATSKTSETLQQPSTPPNQAPVAKDDKFSTLVNKAISLPVVDNDLDPDGDDIKILSVKSPTKLGGLVIINDNNTVTYIPNSDFVGKDSFSYTIFDGKGQTDDAKVDITVKVDRDLQQASDKHFKPQEPQIQNNEVQSQQKSIEKNRDNTTPNIEQNNGPNSETESVKSNKAPVAVAGEDGQVPMRALVVLDGTKSQDEDGKIVAYSWTQLSGPKVMLQHPNEARSTFIVPEKSDNPLEFQLTVVDDKGFSDSDTLTLDLINQSNSPLNQNGT